MFQHRYPKRIVYFSAARRFARTIDAFSLNLGRVGSSDSIRLVVPRNKTVYEIARVTGPHGLLGQFSPARKCYNAQSSHCRYRPFMFRMPRFWTVNKYLRVHHTHNAVRCSLYTTHHTETASRAIFLYLNLLVTAMSLILLCADRDDHERSNCHCSVCPISRLLPFWYHFTAIFRSFFTPLP